MSRLCLALSGILICCMLMTLQYVVADKCVSKTTSIMPNELEIVSEWLVDNKLSLHFGKT